MTVLARTEARRQAGASAHNRRKKEANGKRVEEIGAVIDVEIDYHAADRAGDLEVEKWFSETFQHAESEDMKRRIVKGYQLWGRTEQREELAVTDSVSEATTLMRENNEFWLGSYVPDGDGGAA